MFSEWDRGREARKPIRSLRPWTGYFQVELFLEFWYTATSLGGCLKKSSSKTSLLLAVGISTLGVFASAEDASVAESTTVQNLLIPDGNNFFSNALKKVENQILSNALRATGQQPDASAVATPAEAAPAPNPNVPAPQSRSWLAKEWAKADFTLDLPVNFVQESMDNESLLGFVKYRQEVRPSRFESQYQDRRDIIQLRLQAASNGFNGLFDMSILWSRLFKLEDKWKIWKIPRPSKIPFQWQKALLMDPGEVVRMQMLFGAGYGRYEDLLEGESNPTLPIGFALSGNIQVFIDIYRLAGSRVEVRVAGVKTPINPSIFAGLSAWNPVTATLELGLEAATGWINRQIARYARVEPLALAYSWTASDQLRTDTKVVIYELDLSSVDGQTGYKNLINFGAMIEILKQLRPFNSSDEVVEKLSELTKPIDDIHFRYVNEPDESKRPVIRRLIGDILSDVDSMTVRSNLMGRIFVRGQINNFSADSNVTVRDPHDQPQHYRFLSGQRNMEWRALLQLRGDNDSRSINALFKARQNTKTDFVPHELTDAIFRREFSAKKMSGSQIRYFKQHFKALHPWGWEIPWKGFEDERSKDRGNVIYEYVFNLTALVDLPRKNAMEIHEAIRNLLDNYPDPEELLVSYTPLQEPNGRESLEIPYYPDEIQEVVKGMKARVMPQLYNRVRWDRFERDIRFIAVNLANLLTPKDPLGDLKIDVKDTAAIQQQRDRLNTERYKAFTALKGNNLFFELGPALWLSMLPQFNVKKYVKFTIFWSHEDHKNERPWYFDPNDDLKTLLVGQKPPEIRSDLYRTVQSQMVFLQSRDFDNIVRLKALLSSQGIRPQAANPNQPLVK